MVGTAFCLGLEDSEICRLIEGLERGVEDLCRVAFAHDEHTQAAFLRTEPGINRGKGFIAAGMSGGGYEEPRMISRCGLDR